MGSRGARSRRSTTARISCPPAFVLLLGGLAAKIGWAPVHNWLPDAHSEAPPPVSALLSSALLPAVLVVAWRSDQALAARRRRGHGAGCPAQASGSSRSQSPSPSSGARSPGSVCSRTRAWSTWACSPSASPSRTRSRWQASSCTSPATRSPRPSASTRQRHCSRTSPAPAGEPRPGSAARPRRSAPSLGISLGTLAGLPPSPLFVERGPHRRAVVSPRAGPWEAAAAAILLALGFLGLGHALHRDDRREGAPSCARASPRGLRTVVALTAVATVGLLSAHRPRSLAAGLGARRGNAESRMNCVPRSDRWRRSSSGWSFAGLYAVVAWRPRASGARERDRRAPGRIRRAPSGTPFRRSSIVVPAANWDEREAHDLYGVRFDGHEPLRPLVEHDLDVARWTVPVQGRDPYQVAVGPIHAGVIESGHFRFHLVGEKILHLDARLFYKHRGLERAAEGHEPRRGRPLRRAGHVRHAPSRMASRTRRLSRKHSASRLRPSSAVRARSSSSSSESGATSTTFRPFARERASPQARNALPVSPSAPVGSTRVSPATGSSSERSGSGKRPSRSTLEAVSAAREELVRTARRGGLAAGASSSSIARSTTASSMSASFARRTRGGSVQQAQRREPPGMAMDVQAASPRLAYEGFVPVVSSRAAGDVQVPARAATPRARPVVRSARVAPRCIRSNRATRARGGRELSVGASRVESPRGATLCVVERDGKRIARVHLRTGSYANWPAVAFAAVGNMLPDFPLINKSFELCYACADR